MSRLSNDDSCAVDLLLDRDQAGVCYSTSSSQSVIDRLAHAEKVLQLLNNLDHSDPPPELAVRTMARCDSAAQVRTITHFPSGPSISASE